MGQELTENETQSAGGFAQWFGVLGGPLAWAMQLQTNYALLPHACDTENLKWVHIASAAFLLLALSAVFVAAMDRKKARPVTSHEPLEARRSFMGRLGILTSSLFALVIIAQWIPVLFFNPCQQ
jgi:hypothetical protein